MSKSGTIYSSPPQPAHRWGPRARCRAESSCCWRQAECPLRAL